jgi:hypothetical protein
MSVPRSPGARRRRRRHHSRARSNGGDPYRGGLRPGWELPTLFTIPCADCTGELQVQTAPGSGFGPEDMEAFAREQGWWLDVLRGLWVCHACAPQDDQF